MILQGKTGQEKKEFISYVEKALSKLAVEEYTPFLNMFDSSRMSEAELVLALKYLDEDWPITKIDDPVKTKCDKQRIDIVQYKDGSGYHMDYDLTTDGELNDLTIQIEFLKHGDGYLVSLEDLHTM